MRKRTLLIGLLVVGMLAGGIAWAAEGDGAKGPLHGRFANTPLGQLITGQIGRLLVLKSQMNVTPEQRDQVKAILVQHKPEIVAVIKDIVAKKRAVHQQVLADKVDEQAIHTATSDLGKSIGDAAVLAAKIRGEISPLLNDQQKKLLQQFRVDSEAAVDQWLNDISQAPAK